MTTTDTATTFQQDFIVPVYRIGGLTPDSDPVKIHAAARQAWEEASNEAKCLLDTMDEPWVSRVFYDRAGASSRRLLGALRRLNFAEHEVARDRAVHAETYLDFVEALDVDCRKAMEQPIPLDVLDFPHQKLVRAALRILKRIELESRRLDSIVDRDERRVSKDPHIPANHHSKGGRRNTRRNPARER